MFFEEYISVCNVCVFQPLILRERMYRKIYSNSTSKWTL